MSQQIFEQLPPEETGAQKDFRQFIRDILETIFISVVLFLAINALSARIRVESISMQPTLFEGDMVLVNRVAYKLGFPQRGDIIIFRFPLNPDSTPFIKRVIGLPGDTINVENGTVFINGKPLSEAYLKTPPYYSGTWKVPEGELFVLGDNRNNSSDSHEWGSVPLVNVIGKAQMIYWPPDKWKVLNPATALAASP